jgi:hypothetical protein
MRSALHPRRVVGGQLSLYPYFLVSASTPMLAKKTSKNQLTLPKAVVNRFPGVDYYDVTADDDAITLRPVRTGAADAVRSKLESLGIKEADIAYAVRWGRRKR